MGATQSNLDQAEIAKLQNISGCALQGERVGEGVRWGLGSGEGL